MPFDPDKIMSIDEKIIEITKKGSRNTFFVYEKKDNRLIWNFLTKNKKI